ncbi:NmrA family transcriptional regulator [Aquimarina sp. AD10]|uniref:NmrA family NAD(P)-binding protein n=1 Tax=Aquimarina sp. AD10 TaxID=1714849 RepID=UPI000E46EED2|nr:NAD(P)H-binding protein [Aquimarina sp. AD10]AXT60074.1 NmrA family transcriptional regulator [Aquimarina sp. AD10]RKM96216.1 NmrA family transcriptional regulator [Aquimarina sp. AD10]
MKLENILVIGGTGKTGRKIVHLLKESGHNVRVGSRSAQPSFDWHQPGNWSKALSGMDKVYITYQPDLAVPGALEAIEELVNQARKSSVKKLVLLSGKGEREAELCEQVVIHSGIDYTIVRASWFNQNFNENFLLDPVLDGVVALPQAEVKIPFVDTDDIAEVAVKAILDDKHNGQIYQLTGPELLTFKQAIATIANASNRAITFVPISIQEYSQGMRDANVPEDFIWLIEYLFTEVLGNPKNSEITNDIEQVLKRKPISFTEYAEKVAATGVWNGLKETV